MVNVTSNLNQLVAQLKSRQALDSLLPEDVKLAATAELLKEAKAAIDVASGSPRKVLGALAGIEKLARLAEGTLQRAWLAVRALDLKAGQKVGGPELMSPVTIAILAASNLIPTLDPNEAPQGWLGAIDAAEADRLSDKTRIVTTAPFAIRTNQAPLFDEPASGAALADLLDASDRLSQKAKAAVANTNIAPLAYEALVEANIVPAEGDALFAEYRLSRMVLKGAQPHPTPLVEPAALASVAMPVPSYQPYLEQSLLARGVLSDVQVEGVIYAGQAHDSFLPTDPTTGLTPRRGFLNGHGTGVGKGRINGAIILDNWNQGRRRAIWMSENQKLHKDATRDWVALGGRPSDLMRLIDTDTKADLPSRNGILFVTYALLRSPERMKQIIDWFGQTGEGVMVFDECQAGRNAMSNGKDLFGGANSVSQQGVAMLDLQDKLPNARVVYSSATSAMDIVGLGYASRLGLWGPGTAFPQAQHFFTQMEKGGIGALELVARDMKAMGLYAAANLSMEGVRYEREEFRLTQAERDTQDTLSEAWTLVNTELMRALVKAGIPLTHVALKGKIKGHANGSKGAAKRFMSTAKANFRQSKARFFQAFLASVKMRRLLPMIAADVARGSAPIVQITNTYEASLTRSIETTTTEDFSDVDASAREILLGFVIANWPIAQMQLVKNAGGNSTYQPVKDANGNIVVDQQALADRNAIVAQLKGLDIPDCPLEQVIGFFGKDAVAEVTGRSKRLVPAKTGNGRVLEDRTPADVEEDVRGFQEGRKAVLVFSTSGATGASYHAARTAKNHKLRRHYLLQAGWRADQAIQGLGRSHRSDEVQPPVYILVQCDLWADKRMISTVASGMEALGALTRGQRQAAAQELFTQDDNLESELATTAWVRFMNDLQGGNVPGLDVLWFERETGIPLRHVPGTQIADSDMPTVKRFLTAMSGMTCERQEAFGEAYRKRLDDVKMEAIQSGTFDRGVEWIQAASVIKLTDDVVWKDPRSGAATRLVQMLKTEKVTPITYEEARDKAMAYGGNARVAVNGMTNRVAIVGFPESNFMLDALDQIMVVTPKGEQIMKRYRFDREFWRMVSPDEAKRLWQIELTQIDKNSESEFHLVTGMLLPIWDKLPQTMAQVYRLETDDGEKIIGRVVPSEWAGSIVKRLSGGNVAAKEALEALEAGGTATLANGWVVFTYQGKSGTGIELAPIANNEDAAAWTDEMSAVGVIVRESHSGKLRFVLPTEEKARNKAWKSIAAKWPVMGVSGLKQAA